MREMVIGHNDAGQRLDKFLSKAVPLLPKNLMYKFLRTKYIKLNGKKAEISTRLSEGDRVTSSSAGMRSSFFFGPLRRLTWFTRTRISSWSISPPA